MTIFNQGYVISIKMMLESLSLSLNISVLSGVCVLDTKSRLTVENEDWGGET